MNSQTQTFGWVSYFWTGAVIIIASWVLTGCRLGNSVQKSTTQSNWDGVTGLYEAEVSELKFCLQKPDESVAECSEARVQNVPLEIGIVMSNPIAFQLSSSDTSQATIFNPYYEVDPPFFKTFVDSTSKSFSAASKPNPASIWDDPNCLYEVTFTVDGLLNQSPDQSYRFPEHQPAGRVEVNFGVIREYDGDCDSVLALMSACYDDPDDCGGTDASTNEQRHFDVINIYGKLIDSNLLDSSEIPNFNRVSYSVFYK